MLGATRVGHGVALRDSEAARALVRERGVCVESCLTSNLLTRAVEGLDSHPARSFVEQGKQKRKRKGNEAIDFALQGWR